MDQATAEAARRALDVLVGESRAGEPFAPRFTATVADDGATIAGRPQLAEPGADSTTDFDLTDRKVRGGDDR